MKKRIGKWLIVILMIYVVAGVLLYLFQNKLLLHPEPLPQDQAYAFSTPFEERKVLYDSSTMFDIVRFKPLNDSIKKGAVIYFHGNMNNIAYYAHFADNFIKHGYEVWMMDYPGFGKSTGEITETMLYIEADEVYKMVRAAGFTKDSIIIYGKSLGTGIAAQLASVRDCKKLILETPYYSLTSLVRLVAFIYPVDLLLHYKMPTHEYLTKVTAPISIFHGTDDGIVPYFNAERLRKVLKSSDEFITVEEGTHTNLYSFPLVQKKLDSLLSN